MSLCIKAENLYFRYGESTNGITVLDHVSIEVPSGTFLGITGPSGSGKSTLLSVLGLLEEPQQGELYFGTQKVNFKDERICNDLRRYQIGYIFQDFQLFDVLTVHENVDYFLARQRLAFTERQQRIQHYLTAVGLWDLRDRLPAQLSGGQKQRLAIARSLAKRPQLIIADEPTANLDRENARLVLETLTDLSRQENVTIITATHDPIAQNYCDRLIELNMGRAIIKVQDKNHAA